MVANRNWSLQCIQEHGGSIVWFGQNAEIPRRFDSLDCATLNFYDVNPEYVQSMYTN